MEISREKIRSYRLGAHHLRQKLPRGGLLAAAAACGLQNTPPGAWETAMFNRVSGCTLQALGHALHQEKTLLQAWSFRGAPVVFPTAESDIFLTPLAAQEGEQPWIYTLGITGALDHLQMPFDDLLARTIEAAAYLDSHTVARKEVLDQTLADIVQQKLPREKQALWRDPSMYGSPEKQTVGGAAISFLLRPCSFHSLVVFGQRQGTSPTFTSYKNWVGHAPVPVPQAEKELVRKFLRCYGPATAEQLAQWLGCTPRQAKRLWGGIQDETKEITVEGKKRRLLADELDSLQAAECDQDRLLLLGAHDPYLDQRDRAVILEDARLHKQVWKYVGNPGAVLKGGRVAGTWQVKTLKGRLEVAITLWEQPAPGEERALKELAEEYAAFRLLRLGSCTVGHL